MSALERLTESVTLSVSSGNPLEVLPPRQPCRDRASGLRLAGEDGRGASPHYARDLSLF